MQAKNEISEELRLLSAVMDSISRQAPYGVPAGYFDSFPARLLSRVGQTIPGTRSNPGANPDSNPIPATGSAMTTVPASDARTPDMDDISEPPFSFGKPNPLEFSVPEGYFDGFAQGLLDKIKAGNGIGRSDDGNSMPGNQDPENADEELSRLSPLLSGIGRQTPYQTPISYFQELSSFLPRLEEVRELPLYTVPEGYFDGLAGEVLSKLAPAKKQEPAKIISLNPGTRQRSWWKYSAAAVVAGLIFTIGWLRLHTSTPGHLAAPADVASNLVKVSDQDLQHYLDDQDDQNSTIAEPMNSTTTLDITDSDVKSLLGDVPDGELKSYMEEHGGPNDIATN